MTGLGESVWALFVAQLLHGLGYIAISLSMALFIQSAVAREARASGQALLNVFCYGLARVLGSWLGGAAARAFGEEGGFIACALVCFASLAAFFPVWKEAFCNSRRDML